MLVKILGAIDVIAALTLLTMVFGIQPWTALVLFSAGLLFLKSLFILTGEPLSVIDLIGWITLVASLVVTPWASLVFLLALLLLAKGTVSFL